MSADDHDPLNEHPDTTRARALASLDKALEQMSIEPDDRMILRDLIAPAWQEWCATMQTARMDAIPQHTVRVAGLALMNTIFWEIIVMTSKPVQVTPVGERYLALLTQFIRMGPGR